MFPRQDPVGKTIRQGSAKYTVIGVVEDSKARTIGEAPGNCVYRQLGGTPSGSSSFFGISMLVKTAGEPIRYEQPVRAAIATLDAKMAVFDTGTMEEHVSKALMLPRISSLLFGLFSAIGLSLAAIGLYAVMSYWVRGRVHEIGIRMALGASAGTVLKMVFRQGLTMAGIGLAIGIGLALLLGRFTANLLYGVSGTDIATYASVCADVGGDGNGSRHGVPQCGQREWNRARHCGANDRCNRCEVRRRLGSQFRFAAKCRHPEGRNRGYFASLRTP